MAEYIRMLRKPWIGRIAFLAFAAVPLSAYASPPQPLCNVLRAFVESLQPEESRALSFHTIWGAGFTDTPDGAESAAYAKRCDHGGYAPAAQVCGYLMEHGYAEYSDDNAKDVITCLSPQTRFARGVSMTGGDFSFAYGKEPRANVEVSFQTDTQLGGKVLRISVERYADVPD